MESVITGLVSRFGYWGVLLLIAVENIFPPIPSEVILTFGGFLTTCTEMTPPGIILFSTLGSVAGALIGFDTTGIDFAMTALFLVIAVDQWQTYRSHLPVLLGFGVTVVSLALLGPDAMLIPALCVIVVSLLLLRTRLDARAEAQTEKEAV